MSTLSIVALTSATCLVVVWLAYPAVMAVLAHQSGRHSATARLSSGTSAPRVTVVIATRDLPGAVIERVRDCLDVDWPGNRLQVIVSCDASAADISTLSLGRALENAFTPGELERVTVVQGDAPGGKALALNAAVRRATGDILVFTDAGQRFASDAIARLIGPLMSREYGIVSGSLELPTPSSGSGGVLHAYWAMERMLRRDEARVHSTIGVTGAIYAMPASLWSPLPAGLLLDDVYVPMKLVLAGERVGFVREARATETRHSSAAREYQRKVRTLTGVLQLCAWLPGVLVPVRNPVWVQFVIHKLLRLLTPYWLFTIAVWALVEAAQVVGAVTLVAVVLLSAAIVRLAPGPFRTLRSAAAAGLLLQWAVVVATSNGVRRRWHVWEG